ncbi:hypothetical protein EG68_03461 [Paragonimus skrjabini miyazakii]|uniref:Uncharacterized protein n=1 Tax=Paragonimus skrjabini miyazakii TaxID=59628 RepID=A0A8S9Z2U8_9TREM|nr:hypothetical protein EG68_03461 [Paragonimus skrjabini miyazakii]
MTKFCPLVSASYLSYRHLFTQLKLHCFAHVNLADALLSTYDCTLTEHRSEQQTTESQQSMRTTMQPPAHRLQ